MRKLAFLLALPLLSQEPPKAPAIVSPVLALQMRTLHMQAEILKRQACEDAGVKFAVCEVDWTTGAVTEAKPKTAEQ